MTSLYSITKNKKMRNQSEKNFDGNIVREEEKSDLWIDTTATKITYPTLPYPIHIG